MPIKVREGGEWVQVSDGADGTDGTGKLLQLKSSKSTIEVQRTTTKDYYSIFNKVRLTTVGTNSQFFLIGYAHVYNNSSALSRHNIGFAAGAPSTDYSALGTRIAGVDGTQGDEWGCNAALGETGATLNRSALWSPGISAGTTLDFNLLGARWDPGGTSYWNYSDLTLGSYNHNNIITVMEIAA
jgi:hypothetical protein